MTDNAICGFETASGLSSVRSMTTLEQLVAAAKQLPLSQREELCEQIAESLDAPLTLEESAWVDLAARRSEELRSNLVKGVPLDEVLAKARKQLGL